jgi:hypothetical protein
VGFARGEPVTSWQRVDGRAVLGFGRSVAVTGWQRLVGTVLGFARSVASERLAAP